MKVFSFSVLALFSNVAFSQALDIDGISKRMGSSVGTNMKIMQDECTQYADARATATPGADVDKYAAKTKAQLDCTRAVQPLVIKATASRAAVGVGAGVGAATTDPDAAAAAAKLTQAEVDTAEQKNQDAKFRQGYFNMSWGIGLGVSIGKKHVTDAEIVDGIVRVKTEEKYQPRVVLEAHQFMWCQGKGDKAGTTGCGPFAAIVTGSSDQTISGFGLGWMYGMKSKGQEAGFSIGLGLIVDQKVKDLAPDFQPNQPAPAGATAVRYEEKSRASWLLFVTRTF